MNFPTMCTYLFRKALIMNFICLLFFALLSCRNESSSGEARSGDIDKTMLLIDWMKETGSYISSPEIPSIIDAQVVYSMRNENILVIDLRPPEEFNEGHIEHSVNIPPDQVLSFFIGKIVPSSFKSIFFVCNDLSISGYVTGVMRLLGYNNVFAIRFGMSGWDRNIAGKFWLANISNKLLGKLEIKGFPMNEPGDLPVISAVGNSGHSVALEQAYQALQHPVNFNITIDEWLKNPEAYYTICYWPEDKYFSNGHLPGAVHYEPKESLKYDMYLNTLPVDKPIVVYCYSGQHSTFVVAYLRMLGYDAKSLMYGANAFIHDVMAKTEPRPTRTFTENLIQNLPVVRGEVAEPEKPGLIETEKVKVTGGC